MRVQATFYVIWHLIDETEITEERSNIVSDGRPDRQVLADRMQATMNDAADFLARDPGMVAELRDVEGKTFIVPIRSIAYAETFQSMSAPDNESAAPSAGLVTEAYEAHTRTLGIGRASEAP